MSAADLDIAVDGICREINHSARSRAMRGTNILRSSALEVLGKDGSGRRYGRHVASSPGQPPSPDTSSLRNFWRQRHTATPNGQGRHGLRITLSIKSDMKYEPFLEHGTRFILPRPHKQRIKDKARPQIAALFASI